MTDFTFAETPAAVGLIPECTYPSTAEAFEGLIRDEYKSLARTIFALRRCSFCPIVVPRKGFHVFRFHYLPDR
jgi:hypothetical protein